MDPIQVPVEGFRRGQAEIISITAGAQSAKGSMWASSSAGTTQPFSVQGRDSRLTRKKFWSPLPMG